MTTATVSPQVLERRRQVSEAVAAIRERSPLSPEVALVLGSGLGDVAKDVEDAVVIPYADIPHFPTSTAPGHAGNLVLGTLAGRPVVVQQGRCHTYEGYTAQQATFPMRVIRELGARTLIVTCAAGGLNRLFKAGDLMVITDHLNLTGTNPLIGPNDPECGPRFPVMFEAYRPELRELAHRVASNQGLRLQEGVYAGITGPVFFTPAELNHLITIGADALGMSTVHEVIVAVHSGMRVLGLGLISDMAIPDSGHHATEQEILSIVTQTAQTVRRLVLGILSEL